MLVLLFKVSIIVNSSSPRSSAHFLLTSAKITQLCQSSFPIHSPPPALTLCHVDNRNVWGPRDECEVITIRGPGGSISNNYNRLCRDENDSVTYLPSGPSLHFRQIFDQAYRNTPVCWQYPTVSLVRVVQIIQSLSCGRRDTNFIGTTWDNDF